MITCVGAKQGGRAMWSHDDSLEAIKNCQNISNRPSANYA